MARRRRQIVIEDATDEMLNDERDAQRRVLERSVQQYEEELDKRASRYEHTGNYRAGMFVEVEKRQLAIKGGNSAPHAHLLEYGSGPRSTKAGADRGAMPKIGVIRKASLAMRRKIFDDLAEELKRV